MNKFFVILAIMGAASCADAFVLFGSGGTATDASHADNIDNANGTNVYLIGQSGPSFFQGDANSVQVSGTPGSLEDGEWVMSPSPGETFLGTNNYGYAVSGTPVYFGGIGPDYNLSYGNWNEVIAYGSYAGNGNPAALYPAQTGATNVWFMTDPFGHVMATNSTLLGTWTIVYFAPGEIFTVQQAFPQVYDDGGALWFLSRGEGRYLRDLQDNNGFSLQRSSIDAEITAVAPTNASFATNDPTGWPLSLSITNWYYTNTASVSVTGNRSLAIGTNGFGGRTQTNNVLAAISSDMTVGISTYYNLVTIDNAAGAFIYFALYGNANSQPNPSVSSTPMQPGTYTNFMVDCNYFPTSISSGTNLTFIIFTNGVPAVTINILAPGGGSATSPTMDATNSFTLVGLNNTGYLVVSNNSANSTYLYNESFTVSCSKY